MTEPTQTPEPQDPQQTSAAPAPPQPPGDRTAQALKSLMAKEAEIRQKEGQFKQYETRAQQAEELEAAFKSPEKLLAYAEKYGVTYEQLTAEALKRGRPDPSARLTEKISDLERRLQERDSYEEQRRKEEALNELRSEVTRFVESRDDFPLTKRAGLGSSVFDVMVEHHNRTGDYLSEEQAAKQVEDHLSGMLEKLLEDESIRSRVLEKHGTQYPPRAPQATTLSNRDAAPAPTRSHFSPGSVQDRELSMQEAAKLIRWVNND